MRKTLFVCAVALIASFGAVQAQQMKTGGGTEKAIAALEQQWVAGSKASNPDMVAPLLADKLINTDADGKTDGKAETLARVKGQKWQSQEISNVKVVVFGDTAIATGNWAGKGTDTNGKPIDQKERWTDTWMKMSDGKWQCIASQSTPSKM